MISPCLQLPCLPIIFSGVPVEDRFQTLGSVACVLNNLRPLNFSEVLYSFHPCSFQDFENKMSMVVTTFLNREDCIGNTLVS